MVENLDIFNFQMENPFIFDYFKKQVEFYGNITPTTIGNIKLSLASNKGILPDYLNKNWYDFDFKIPRLIINNQVWMSITPMEVQSMYLPLFSAAYDVYTGGLGLGYFALKAASKKEVHRVIVYEKNENLITWFKKQFEHRPEMQKIEIIHDDFIKALRNEDIPQDEYIFNDIYPQLNTDEALDNFEEFQPNYPGYLFWGMESILIDSLTYGLKPNFIPPYYIQFLKMWINTTIGEATNDEDSRYFHIKLSDLYESRWTKEECQRFINSWYV